MTKSKPRILIKLSGASFKDSQDQLPFNWQKLQNICQQIKKIAVKYQVCIVNGGGNIWRGNMAKNMQPYAADCIGMLSTVMNAIALQDVFQSIGMDAVVYSATPIPKMAKDIMLNNIFDDLEAGKIVIFSAGTGHPYFTTDTCCVIRAFDVQADIILMGKNGTDGVYDADPNKNKNAQFLPKLTFNQAMEKKLEVMDMTALALCANNPKANIYVFNIDKKNALLDVLAKKGEFTHIKN